MLLISSSRIDPERDRRDRRSHRTTGYRSAGFRTRDRPAAHLATGSWKSLMHQCTPDEKFIDPSAGRGRRRTRSAPWSTGCTFQFIHVRQRWRLQCPVSISCCCCTCSRLLDHLYARPHVSVGRTRRRRRRRTGTGTCYAPRGRGGSVRSRSPGTAGQTASLSRQQELIDFLARKFGRKRPRCGGVVARNGSFPALLRGANDGEGKGEKRCGGCRGERRRWRGFGTFWMRGPAAKTGGGGDDPPDVKATPNRITCAQMFRRVPRE